MLSPAVSLKYFSRICSSVSEQQNNAVAKAVRLISWVSVRSLYKVFETVDDSYLKSAVYNASSNGLCPEATSREYFEQYFTPLSLMVLQIVKVWT